MTTYYLAVIGSSTNPNEITPLLVCENLSVYCSQDRATVYPTAKKAAAALSKLEYAQNVSIIANYN